MAGGPPTHTQAYVAPGVSRCNTTIRHVVMGRSTGLSRHGHVEARARHREAWWRHFAMEVNAGVDTALSPASQGRWR